MSLEVTEVDGQTRLKANTIYLCPPRGLLELKNGALRLNNAPGELPPTNSIDHFFHTIAEDQGEHGIGVILSGAGSDGTLGLKAISDHGGLTFAQDTRSAKFDSMPRSAAVTGLADHVLQPDQIAAELLQYAAHLDRLGELAPPDRLHDDIEAAIPKIAESLMKVTNHNFLHYKTNTLVRRIQRRMQVLKIGTAADYLSHVQKQTEEAQALFRELLIGVTAFFRDPDAFAALTNQVLPKLLENRTPDDVIRMWVAGCANGAEAYTMAILCCEAMDEISRDRRDVCGVQIFATDIDERALAIAREGTYPIGIEDHVSPERLRRFFVKRGKKYQVKKEIRDLVLFSTHNLISDPPFSRQDLISCRNLLIYLGPHLQKKLIPLFHYSLRPGGFLFLGPSENIASHGDLFRPVNVKHHISRRKETTLGKPPVSPAPRSWVPPLAGSEDSSSEPDASTDLSAIGQRIVLDEFAPKYVIIDDGGQVLNSSPGAEKYLQIRAGDFQNNILKLAADGLRIGLRAAIADAKKARRRAQHTGMSIRIDGQVQPVMVTVQPMPRLGEDEPLLMVVFHDVGLPLDSSSESRHEPRDNGDANQLLPSSVSADSVIAQLEHELETTRTDLDKSMQDMEAAHQEMKSSNEELLSMNEELQSANEELETSKEEIRATSDAISRANDDLENLLRSTQIATVFLDDQLNIRSFTPAIADIYPLIPTDIGRPLEKFVPSVKQMPPLPSVADVKNSFDQRKPDANRLTTCDTPLEHNIQAYSGKSYIRRVLPYQSHTGESEGIVVTFTDVTELIQSQQRFRSLIDASAQIVWVTNPEGEVVEDSPSWRAFTGQTYDEWIGQGWLDAVHPDDRESSRAKWQETVTSGKTLTLQHRLRHHRGGYRWTQVRAVAERALDGSIRGWVGMITDITEQKAWEGELKDRETQLRRVIDNTIAFIAVIDIDGTLREANASVLKSAGLSREDLVGKKYWDLSWWKFDSTIQQTLQELIGTATAGKPVRQDMRYQPLGDAVRPLDFMLNPVYDSNGKVAHLVASGIDILDRKQTENELIRAKQRLDLTLEVSDVAPWSWDTETMEIVTTPMLNRLFGFPDDAKPKVEDFLAGLVESDRDRVTAAIQRTINDGEDYAIDYQVIRPSGETRHVRAVGKAEFAGDGGFADFIGVAIDITEQKDQELDLAQREAHLRRVINNQLGLVGVIDREGYLLEVDDRSLEIAKTRREDVIGKPFADAPWWNYDPAVALQIRDAMERAFAGEIVRYDVSLFAHGDDGVMIDFMIAPVKNDAGEVEYLIPSGVDIRERYEAEIQSRKSEHLVRTIAENSTQGLVMMDDTGHVIYCNHAFLKMTGFDAVEIRSKPLHDLIHHHHPDGRPYPMSECPIDRALPEDFSVRAHEDLFFRKDGSTFPVMCAASPIFEGGIPTSTVIEIRDTTEQQLQERELNLAATRLENSMTFAGIAAWGWDRDKQRLILDSQLKRMWGFDENDEVSLDDFTNRIDAAHRDRVVKSINVALQQFKPYREDYPITLPSGQHRWIRAIGQATPSATGDIEDFFGVTIDITTDRRQESKARFRVELLEQLTELSEPIEIMRLATQRIAEHFQASRCYLARICLDDQTSEVFHESHAEHLKPIRDTHRISDFLSSQELNGVIQGNPVRIDDIRQSGYSEVQMNQFDSLGIAAAIQGSFETTKSLHRTIFVTKQQPYRWRDDEVHFLDNLTEMVYLRIERAESQMELERARAAAEAASASKSAFVANMSHEIRTPMTAILGYTDLIREHVTSEEAVEHLQTVRRNGDYLLEIINDILDLSKIEAGKLDIESERFHPAHVIEDVRRIMEVRANEGGLELQVEYVGSLPQLIESDGKRLKQILINLVGNAIKFTRQGGVNIRVRYEGPDPVGSTTSAPNDENSPNNYRSAKLYFDVIDTGIGMSEQQQQKLFKPFSQCDSSVSRHFGGTGLGLAISKRLAKMLGGEITPSSTLGVGSTFTLAIDIGDSKDIQLVQYCVDSSQKHESPNRPYAAHSGHQHIGFDEKPLANRNVLIVDDRRDIRFLSKTILTKAGATVEECEDGQQAVEFMTPLLVERHNLAGQTADGLRLPTQQILPDLILLDMQMPNLDGYETARVLRKLGYAGSIIALTADAMQGDMNDCIAAGCNNYLSKPIDANRLIQLVQELTNDTVLSDNKSPTTKSRPDES